MPSRNQTLIRRDINRLHATIERHKETQTALAVIAPHVQQAADAVNSSWQQYQQVSVSGDSERMERDTAIDALMGCIRRWRPAMMILMPGAEANIRNLPSRGATPDDVIRVAEDMRALFEEKGDGFDAAIVELEELLTVARKETGEAVAMLPAEDQAREAYTEACLKANAVLVRGTEIVRAIFGRTSPEYKQFIARSSQAEEEAVEQESMVGEE